MLGSTWALVAQEVAQGRLVPLEVGGLPALFAAMGMVSLRKRSPSPLARKAMALISETAARVNAAP